MSTRALNPRLAVAVCAAPVAAFAIASVCAAALMRCVDEMCVPALLPYGAMYGVMLGLALGWPTMMLIGLPLHGWLLRHVRTGVLSYVLAGAVAAMAPTLASEAVAFAQSPADRPAAAVLIFGAATGVLCGLLFWLIRRPDRDAANPPTSTT